MDHSLESQEIGTPIDRKSQKNYTNYYYGSDLK
jgi:hypothetical protein